MMAAAWCLYAMSLFLPAADLRMDTTTGKGDGTLESGCSLLAMTLFPLFWIFVSPFVYFLVNVIFLYSLGIFWRRFRGQLKRRNVYSTLIALSAIAAWIAPVFTDAVGPGYFAWSGAITLAAVAFLVPLADTEERHNVETEPERAEPKQTTPIPADPKPAIRLLGCLLTISGILVAGYGFRDVTASQMASNDPKYILFGGSFLVGIGVCLLFLSWKKR